MGALWSFIHGEIMDGGIRTQLREHWGLCPRHAWGHAFVDIELWEQGTATRAGHLPFDAEVLHEELLGDAVGAFTRPLSRRRLLRALARKGRCRVCVGLSGSHVDRIGYAGQSSGTLTRIVDQLGFTRELICASRGTWRLGMCPSCAWPGSTDAYALGSRPLLCRHHTSELLAADGLYTSTQERIASQLKAVLTRLRRHIETGSWADPNAQADPAAAWVEALGWTAGWDPVLAIAADCG
ncbi:hypothetical protein N865_16775 [Intrasporangium oryzae NRRL B-24470]|uniref:Uncharacterized protein n=1 Tax=Intrasporangium oryzae NRRL B-24470 TaxID=1386089 RepID=W9GFD7_9MICO|nr:hypothetical protein [Intrasporangium oryzae]EWT03518.1 hypothetical protein N865_16775 [Intrasporangium oryzae NRRL B-24470]